jgi:calcium-translocating P-type ATPase
MVPVSTAIHRASIDEAFLGVRSGPAGLSSIEAARRLAEYGANRIHKGERESPIIRLVREFFRFFSVILWIAAGLAFVAEWAEPGEGMAQIGYTIVAVILISGVFSFWQEYRIERTLAALQQLLPEQTEVIRDGTGCLVPIEQLVVGDIVVLEQGDKIPADCRLIEAFGVKVNTATVTGESIAHVRDAAPSLADDLLHSRNIVLAGTNLVAGKGKALVYATGPHTEFGQIAHLAQTKRTTISPLRRELARLSYLIAILAIVIGVVFFAAGVAIGVPFWKDLIFSIGIIVAMVPEGLLPTLTLSLVLAAQRMAKRNVLIRNLTSVETLGSATVICTDKTGTLTENRMEAREVFLDSRRHLIREIENDRSIAARHADFFACANFCHDVRESMTDAGSVLLGDPMDIALLKMHRAVAGGSPAWRRLDEIPFDSASLRQTVVHETPDGARLFCKGAPEAILAICSFAFAQGTTRPLDQPTQADIVQAQNAMAAQGLRVIAFASRDLAANWSHEGLESNLVFQGLVGLRDPPRPEVPRAIATCHTAGVKVIMITGDHPNTAKAIAAEVGLLREREPTVITGETLRALSPVALGLALDARDVIFARVSATDKMRIVEALKSKGHIVAVTGDGANDAPALKAAHIGVAMGLAGTDVAKEAADMVLLDDNFASIVNAVEEGRAVFQNIRKFLTYVLVHNVAELVPYLAFALFAIPLALTPIQILLIDMGSDSLTGLGLGVEKPDPQGMRQPPRPQSEPLLTLPIGLRAYLFLGPIEAAAAMAAFFLVLVTGGWSYGGQLAWNDPLYLRATCACLSGVIVMQIVNVFLCRSAMRSVFAMPLFGNPLIVLGVVFEIALLLAANYLPWANALLGTLPVPTEAWLLLIPFALGIFALEELRKAFVRRQHGKREIIARN